MDFLVKQNGNHNKQKSTDCFPCFFIVVPMGERSYYDVEDFHKILEFTGLLEPFSD